MDQGLLVGDTIAVGERLVREFNKYTPVTVAFWLKESDSPYRYLYIAYDESNGPTTYEAYGEIGRLALPMDSMYFNPLRIKLIGADQPAAKAALEIAERYPLSVNRLMGSRMFGSLFADDVFVYPKIADAVAVS
jgi:hypothetical protein